MRFLGLKVVGFVSLAFLSSCASPPGVPDDYYYRLPGLETSRLVEQSSFEGLWFVEKPSAEEPRIGRGITYSTDPSHLSAQNYHYNHWEETPPLMVQRRLAAALEGSGLASSIVLRPSPDIVWRLGSRLDRFDRLIDGTEVSAHVSLELSLGSADSAHIPIWHGQFESKVSATDDSMAATAVAFGSALDEVLESALEALARVEKP